uniref:Neuronal acetylcholine receptor subunit alpha-7 n=1 Tax=Hucho hucho TaxID=62062 RepID=A0A4W5Q805_9TELE
MGQSGNFLPLFTLSPVNSPISPSLSSSFSRSSLSLLLILLLIPSFTLSSRPRPLPLPVIYKYLYSFSKQLCLKPFETQGPHQRNLLRELLRDYNRMERPVANDSLPLTVRFSYTLLQVMNVVRYHQWFDHYLQWNQSEYPGVKTLRFTTDQVWIPDILLYNSAHDKFDATFKSYVLVNSSGFCEYLPPGIFSSACNVDVRWFPFDIQRCELKFGSWTFDGWLLDLQMQEADLSGYMSNGEWDLLGVPGDRHEIFYECCTEPYSDVTFVVTLRRRTLFYALNLLVPCVLISSLTLLLFILPARSGEKIGLGITVLLSLTVFMLLVAEIMPATSDSIPLIGQYFVSTMVTVGMSVVATVVVLQYHHHDPNSGDMPQWVRLSLVLLQWVPWFLRMKRPGEGSDTPILHHHPPSSTMFGSPPPQPPTSLDPDPSGSSCVEAGAVGTCHSQPGVFQAGVVEAQLQALLAEVQFLANRFREQDRSVSVAEKWQFAAAVIDRLCLVGFSVFNIICSITILMAAPNFVEAASKDFF